MKTWHRFAISIIVLAFISWFVYSYNKRKEEERKAEARRLQLEGLTGTPQPGILATVLGAFFSFYK